MSELRIAYCVRARHASRLWVVEPLLYEIRNTQQDRPRLTCPGGSAIVLVDAPERGPLVHAREIRDLKLSYTLVRAMSIADCGNGGGIIFLERYYTAPVWAARPDGGEPGDVQDPVM